MSQVVHPTEDEELAHHPSPRQYVVVAVVLAVITAIEVAIYYITAFEDFLVPSLIGFSFLKFVLVALWFMHLRFDSHIFRRLFVTGLVLAFAVFFIVLATFVFREGAAPAVTGG